MDLPTFDPDGPGSGEGIFGLPFDVKKAAVRILPVPFEATCSYGAGTAGAPEAVRRASLQVDLDDPDFGAVWKAGLALDPPPEGCAEASRAAREAALVSLEGGRSPGDIEALRRKVDEAGAARTAAVRSWTAERLRERVVPAILGGDHSCALGALQALGAEGRFSVLQIDAHMDLRPAYEGFAESHASVMFNALETCPDLERLVQVGVRDRSGSERRIAREKDDRIHVEEWSDWNTALCEGHGLSSLLERAFAPLGPRVWVSFDIDGLDPSYCPRTGTPVPGGLGFDQAVFLLRRLAASGRRILGFDLCEVGTPDEEEGAGPHASYDAIVGARLLYKLCGAALRSRGQG